MNESETNRRTGPGADRRILDENHLLGRARHVRHGDGVGGQACGWFFWRWHQRSNRKVGRSSALSQGQDDRVIVFQAQMERLA